MFPVLFFFFDGFTANAAPPAPPATEQREGAYIVAGDAASVTASEGATVSVVG